MLGVSLRRAHHFDGEEPARTTGILLGPIENPMMGVVHACAGWRLCEWDFEGTLSVIDVYTPMAYFGMEFVETPIFTRQVTKPLTDEDYRRLQLHLVRCPEAGAIVPGSGGLRKFRWRLRGRGKRGGARIIYYWKATTGRLYLLFLYPKNVAE